MTQKLTKSFLYTFFLCLILLTSIVGFSTGNSTKLRKESTISSISTQVANKSTHQKAVHSKASGYRSDKNPVTYDENPNNYPLSTVRTYINVDGREIQSPTAYKTPPPGACAICRDGEFSQSKHRQGTCSRHGGVAKWLKNLN